MELLFNNRNDFRDWLKNHQLEETGVWLIFGKKDGQITLSPDEALEEALCFGWIDGQLRSIDYSKYMKYFKKRLKKSNWSSRNRHLVEKLLGEGKMTEAGLRAVEDAKRDGTWVVANEKIEDEDVQTFLSMIKPYQIAYENFVKMSPSIQRTYTGFYLSAKREDTKEKRFQELLRRFELNLKPLERSTEG